MGLATTTDTADADGSVDEDSTTTSGDTDATTGGPVFPVDPADVIRIHVDWSDANGYTLATPRRERSGTEALHRRARNVDELGSFFGILTDPQSGEALFQQAIGTGVSYRELTRAMTFRFPAFEQPLMFTMLGPDPSSGQTQVVLESMIDPDHAEAVPEREVSVTALRAATMEPSLAVTIYSEGYLAGSEELFLEAADRVVTVLELNAFPGLAYMDLNAVFVPSNVPLGVAQDLGPTIPVRDSFLTLYHPYWSSFSRWFHVMYPTDEATFRDGLAQAPYDYPIIITDSAEFWGTGNYNAYTVIPADNVDFGYLLLHEFGHFFGLNEEYSTQDTELLFAPNVAEPWSQNMTFQLVLDAIKWNAEIADGVPLPTPVAQWRTHGVGAYYGGYAGEDPDSLIPVPDGVCTMSSGIEYCPVCSHAIADKLEDDLAP